MKKKSQEKKQQLTEREIKERMYDFHTENAFRRLLSLSKEVEKNT